MPPHSHLSYTPPQPVSLFCPQPWTLLCPRSGSCSLLDASHLNPQGPSHLPGPILASMSPQIPRSRLRGPHPQECPSSAGRLPPTSATGLLSVSRPSLLPPHPTPGLSLSFWPSLHIEPQRIFLNTKSNLSLPSMTPQCSPGQSLKPSARGASPSRM